MRSAAIITTLCAGLAVASPFHRVFHKKALEKKDIEWKYVTDIVTITVTAGQEPPSSTPDSIKTHIVQHTVFVNPVEANKPTPTPSPSSSTPPPPPPPPTTTTTPPPPPPTTQAPAPPAPTTEAPAPVVQVASSSAPAAPSPPASLSGAAQVAVDGHNGLRSQHSANGLAWNDTLAGYAAISAARCDMKHDMTEGGGGYGQNLASQGSTESNAWTTDTSLNDSIVNQWYGEETAFAAAGLYNNPSPPSTVGGTEILHFTQLVWKDSTSVGCAVQACPVDTIFPPDDQGRHYFAWYTVCNYYPAGNVGGEYASNVSEN